jgi:hypothetical protein
VVVRVDQMASLELEALAQPIKDLRVEMLRLELPTLLFPLAVAVALLKSVSWVELTEVVLAVTAEMVLLL